MNGRVCKVALSRRLGQAKRRPNAIRARLVLGHPPASEPGSTQPTRATLSLFGEGLGPLVGPGVEGQQGCEQALAVGLAARQPAGASFLYQERSIFDHLFDVSLHGPQLLRPRMLLVNALENQSRRRKDIVVEYLDKLALLQDKHALPAGKGSELVARAVQTVSDKARE